MSNGMIHIQRSFRSDWLKVAFWILGPGKADTSHCGRSLSIGLPLCDVSAFTGLSIRKSNFNLSELVYACANSQNERRICIISLDMYRLA